MDPIHGQLIHTYLQYYRLSSAGLTTARSNCGSCSGHRRACGSLPNYK